MEKKVVTLQVTEIAHRAEDFWDRFYTDRLAYLLADAEHHLAVLKDQRPVDKAGREALGEAIRAAQARVSAFANAARGAERDIRRNVVLVRGWNGREKRSASIVAHGALAEQAARLTPGQFVDCTVEELRWWFARDHEGAGASRHDTLRRLDVRILRPLDQAPAGWEPPRAGPMVSKTGKLTWPLESVSGLSMHMKLERRLSSQGRPYLALTAGPTILNDVAEIIVEARIPGGGRDGDDLVLTPPEGLRLSLFIPSVPNGAYHLSTAVPWPVEQLDHIELKVLDVLSIP